MLEFILKKVKKNLYHPQNGQAAVIFALVITAVVGITAYVIDAGAIYESRRAFQTIADSAALAAVQELPENPSAAVQAAIDYAGLHELILEPEDVEIGSTYTANDTAIVVAKNQSKKLFFGWIFGRSETPVGANATAVVGSPGEYFGTVPWGVAEDQWEPGSTYNLKVDSPSTPGNFQALALGGTGSSNYENNIANGSSVPLIVGDWVLTETGNMVGPTSDGTQQRVYNKEDYTMNSYLDLLNPVPGGYELARNDSQFVMCPIIAEFPTGRDEVEIIGFAPFLITGISAGEVTGVFLNKALIQYEGEIAGVDNTGVRVIRLLD